MDKKQPPPKNASVVVSATNTPFSPASRTSTPGAAPRLNAATVQQLTEMIRTIGELLEQPEVRSGIVAVSRKVGQALAPLAPALKALGSMALLAGEAVSKLPAQFQQTVVGLANEGWFLDPELAWHDLVESYKAIAAGDVAAAESIMVRHFESRLDGIEAKLSAALPHRASKFKAAFSAHRRGEYDLSILAFMAQADGACAELRGGHFFLRDRKTGKSLAGSSWGMDDGPPMARIARRALYDELPIREQIWRLLPVRGHRPKLLEPKLLELYRTDVAERRVPSLSGCRSARCSQTRRSWPALLSVDLAAVRSVFSERRSSPSPSCPSIRPRGSCCR
jgi:hypothetical protein